MAVVYPNPKIVRHWAGALQASLRRSPLEGFLRFRGLPVASRGATRDTDNLINATMYLLGKGLATHASAQNLVLDEAQQSSVGQMACQICYALAVLIGEPQAWRVAALVSATQQLLPQVKLLAAASSAATAANHFTHSLRDTGGSEGKLGGLAVAAVQANSEAIIEELTLVVDETLAQQQICPAALRIAQY